MTTIDTIRANLESTIAREIGMQWELATLIEQERLLGHTGLYDLSHGYRIDKRESEARQRAAERELRALPVCESAGCDTPDECVSQCASCDAYRCYQHGGYSHKAGESFCSDPDECAASYAERRTPITDAARAAAIAER